MHKILLAAALVLGLQGCASMGNPFENNTAGTSDIYYDQFEDVPIPGDMTIDSSRTLISTSPDGTRIGLLTAEGRVSITSLTQAMEYNMFRQGWTVIGRMSGIKNMDVFEKDNKIAVLYFYEQKIYTAMEIWISQRLIGFVPNTPPPDASAPAARFGDNQLELPQ
jgi:hypothetical protein